MIPGLTDAYGPGTRQTLGLFARTMGGISRASITVPTELLDWLDANSGGLSRSLLITLALDAWLNQSEDPVKTGPVTRGIQATILAQAAAWEQARDHRPGRGSVLPRPLRHVATWEQAMEPRHKTHNLRIYYYRHLRINMRDAPHVLHPYQS